MKKECKCGGTVEGPDLLFGAYKCNKCHCISFVLRQEDSGVDENAKSENK